MHEPLRLHADDPGARSRVGEAVTALLASGAEPPRMRVLLDGDGLPSDLIAALVAGLRRLRERGGAIEAIAANAAVRDALALTGLDRVFAFPIVPDEEPPRRGGFRRLVRGAAAMLALVVAMVALPASAQAPTTDPEAILAKVIARNPSLITFQGRVHVDVAMGSFPYLRQHLDGTAYYKRPANYEVVFDRVPSYAKGFSKLFADVGDPTNWNQRFVVTYEGERDFHGRKDAALRLVQRVRGMIDHETVLVDLNAGTIDQIRYDYYNGGVITMTQTFTTVGNYTMLASQDAEIKIPHVRAVAHGEYTDYQTNVAVDDAVFTKK
jgi:outer membrane lipoprotein-sorting protein